MFGYVPPPLRWSAVTKCNWSCKSLYAWSPSSNLAHKFTFQPMDHPVDSSPLNFNEVLAASNNSGVLNGEIWLLGNKPYKCDTCLCLSSGSSQSINHSCNCPCLPMCIGAIFDKASFNCLAKEASSDNILVALITLVNKSKTNWLSIVVPAAIVDVPSSPACVFSGEFDGTTTKYPELGSLIIKSKKNVAAPFMIGKMSFK